MHEAVSEWLRAVLQRHASEEQIRDVLTGWQRYFDRLCIPEDAQKRDFDATMRMRVASGCISVIADDVDKVLVAAPQEREWDGG